MGPAGHFTFSNMGPPQDELILAAAGGFRPDVIVYSGANGGTVPSIETLQKLREVAPTVHYQGDLEDEEWHPVLRSYRDNKCFDLVMAQTGVQVAGLTDYATLTAISPEPYDQKRKKKRIRCGFSGNFGSEDPRGKILSALGSKVNVRPRDTTGTYVHYVWFLNQCVIMFNTSYTGSGLHHHVKGRVVEAAWACCALLEMRDSPTKEWFPEDTFFQYGSVEEALEIISTARLETIREKVSAFKDHALRHYHPAIIYGDMLNRLGIDHDPQGTLG